MEEEEGEELHRGIICDVCDGDEYIIGPRYKCEICEDSYDLCRKHYEERRKHHDIDHTFRRKRTKKRQKKKKDEEVHYGIICDVCDDDRSIIGPRYNCKTCDPSYDLCQKHFERRKRHHNPDHYFKRKIKNRSVQRKEEELHSRINCDVCDDNRSIRGPRWKCTICSESYDLCQRHYEERGEHHDTNHKFRRKKMKVFSRQPFDKDDERFEKRLDSFSDISVHSSLHSEILKHLEVLLVTDGPSRNEEEILDYISKEIESTEDYDELIMVRDMNFGVFVIVPSRRNEKNDQTILLDVHVDSWKEKYIQPVIFETKIRKRKKERRIIIKATALDNRIHCAALLTLVKRVRFENTRYVALFSVQEEIGMCGAKYFSRNVDLPSYGIESIDLVLVLDVCDGILEHNIKPKKRKKKRKKSKEEAIIGAGFCPVGQDWGPEDGETGRLGVTDCCNTMGFVFGLCEDVYKGRLGCPCCYMHEFSEYASVSDLFELFDYVSTSIEEIIRDGKNQKKLEEEMEEESGGESSD